MESLGLCGSCGGYVEVMGPVEAVGTQRDLWKLWGHQGLQEYVETVGTHGHL